MIRRCSILLLAISATLPVFAQRSQQQQTGAEVLVTVTFEDNHQVPSMARISLFTSARMPVAEQFANDRGQASFRVSSGNYLVQATSLEGEAVESSFTIQPREAMHSEYLLMKRKSKKDADSHEGSISAAQLNIPDKARKEFDKGLSAFDKDDFNTAAQHFSKAVEIYPQYALALVNLGVIDMKENNMVGGQQYFEAAIKADPQLPNGYTALARVKILQTDYAEADTLLTKALSIRPLDPEPLTMLATSESRSGKYDMALATARKVHNVPHEHYAVVHIIAADALLKLNEPQMAADEYRLYLKEFPASPNAEQVRTALQSIENQAR
jgi:tetratricopeptide (TPR) repeat protein